jgi:hypothetical protein
MSSLTLPTWGCLRDGALYELPTPAHHTIALDCSSLPTPRAANGDLRNQTVYMRAKPRRNLEEVLALLPTPAVNDMGAGKDPQVWDEWTQRMRQAHGNGNGHGKSLEQEALRVGANTPQPLNVGSTSSDDQHQPQLFDETTATA